MEQGPVVDKCRNGETQLRPTPAAVTNVTYTEARKGSLLTSPLASATSRLFAGPDDRTD